MDATTEDINKLAVLLKDKGAEVLNGACKLTLSLNLLGDLNNAFEECVDQAFTPNGDAQNIHYLHDFIERTVSLKLTPDYDKHQGISLAKFKSLTLFEAQKVPIDKIFGLEIVRRKLQFLICQRSINEIADVILKCGGDDSTVAVVWQELKKVCFSHNGIKRIDDSILLMPSLHTLDLSHNQITDASSVTSLPNLKYLNLGYNKLVQVPSFIGNICHRLQVLILRNNFIEDISELSSLVNVYELDLSENCIIDHNSLAPLASWSNLQSLLLLGNPISFHPQHRSKTTSCLHANIRTVRFILDKTLLSKSEQKLAGMIHPRKIKRDVPQPQQESLAPVFDTNRVREAHISEGDEEEDFPEQVILGSVNCSTGFSNMLSSGDHEVIQRQLNELKEGYNEIVRSMHSGARSTPITDSEKLISAEINLLCSENDETVYKTAQEELEVEEESSIYRNIVDDVEEDERSKVHVSEKDEEMFLVTPADKFDPVLLVISPKRFIELDASMIEQARWPIESFVHFTPLDIGVELEFDTIRVGYKRRKYHVDPSDHVKLKKLLSDILEKRPPTENTFKIYKCMKCETQFGVEKKKTIHDDDTTLECPSCKSKMVFEDS